MPWWGPLEGPVVLEGRGSIGSGISEKTSGVCEVGAHVRGLERGCKSLPTPQSQAGRSREDHGACATSQPAPLRQGLCGNNPLAAARGSGGAILAQLERLGHHVCVRLSQRPR